MALNCLLFMIVSSAAKRHTSKQLPISVLPGSMCL